jgi:DNA-binding response OmpR family regulator
MTKQRILIIERDTFVTDFLSELLSRENYEIVVVSTSHEAIKVVSEQTFHLIMLDVNLPYIDGEDTYVKIKQVIKDKNIPVVIMSGKGIEPSLIQAIKKSEDTFILKPSEIGVIRERIQECLARHSH